MLHLQLLALSLIIPVSRYVPAVTQPVTPAATSLPTPADDRIAHWTEDLDFLVKEFPARHKNAFFKVPRDDWHARAADLRARLGTLSDPQIVVELRSLIALIGDGHSNLWIDRESAVPPFRQFPYAVVWTSDGLFAAALPHEHEALLTQKLVRIGATPSDAAIERIATIRAYDNESGRRNNVMQDLRDAESLVSLGVLERPDAAPFTFADAAGRETTITLDPISGPPPPGFSMVQKPDPQSLAIGRQPRRAPYGHRVLADRRTFYIWYDTCADQPDKTVAQFIQETLAALDAELSRQPATFDRVVVDFRRNGGGNSVLFMPMIQALAQRDALAQPGKLFGLIGRRTFSSGMMNASQLRSGAKAILVGQPTGGTPNGFGEVRQFRLPHSRLAVQFSTKLFRFDKKDADAVYPDILVEPDAAAFFSPADVILDAAINLPPAAPASPAPVPSK